MQTLTGIDREILHLSKNETLIKEYKCNILCSITCLTQ